MFKWIDHIVVAVKDVERSAADYRDKLGLKPRGPAQEEPQLGLKRVILPLGDSGRFLELAEPLGSGSAIGRTLERRGEGIHLVAMAVEDIKAASRELKRKGVRVLGDANAGEMVFIHPQDTHGILFQLVERK